MPKLTTWGDATSSNEDDKAKREGGVKKRVKKGVKEGVKEGVNEFACSHVVCPPLCACVFLSLWLWEKKICFFLVTIS